MIEIQNVSCRIKNRCILNTISCEIEEGKLTAIIGPNGSGKSTLLKCIMRFINYSGKILIDGKAFSLRLDLAKQVSYFAQTQDIIFPHTVFDAVLMGRRPHALFRYSQSDCALARQAISQMGLTGFETRPIDSLSGGELQKTFFSRTLVQDTKYMLLDEPFNNVDPFYQITIINKLLELKCSKGIVVVLHDTGLLRFFDTVIMIKDGEILKDDHNCGALEQLYNIQFGEFSNGKETVYIPNGQLLIQ
jgi:iron complex transport system ATP-binding protein